MQAYAAQQLDLSAVQKDGSSKRSHLESLARQTGIMQDELVPVDVHPCVMHIWEWFTKLSHKRTVGMSAGPIASLEIEAWCRLHDVVMSPFEVRAIEALDLVYLQASAKEPPP